MHNRIIAVCLALTTLSSAAMAQDASNIGFLTRQEVTAYCHGRYDVSPLESEKAQADAIMSIVNQRMGSKAQVALLQACTEMLDVTGRYDTAQLAITTSGSIEMQRVLGEAWVDRTDADTQRMVALALVERGDDVLMETDANGTRRTASGIVALEATDAQLYGLSDQWGYAGTQERHRSGASYLARGGRAQIRGGGMVGGQQVVTVPVAAPPSLASAEIDKITAELVKEKAARAELETKLKGADALTSGMTATLEEGSAPYLADIQARDAHIHELEAQLHNLRRTTAAVNVAFAHYQVDAEAEADENSGSGNQLVPSLPRNPFAP